MNTQNTNFTRTLRQAGLSADETKVYQRVLEKGRVKASTIIRTTDLKRGHVYNLLSNLVSEDLLEKFEVNGVAHYRLTHPTQLKKDIQQKKNELIRKENTLDRNLDAIISAYKKGHQRPAVQYFEGEDGIQEALHNTLKTDGDIYTYADPQTVKKYMKSENNEYVKKRKAKEINKKLLLFNSPDARDAATEDREFTDIRVLDSETEPDIEASAQIYDDTVTYLTISEDQKIAAQITDKRIVELEKAVFQTLWNQSK